MTFGAGFGECKKISFRGLGFLAFVWD